VGDWAYTYENLDSETQALFTEEEWFAKNQWFADNGSVVYHIESAERLGTGGEPVVEVTLRLTYGDGTSSVRTTYFVQEERHVAAQVRPGGVRPLHAEPPTRSSSPPSSPPVGRIGVQVGGGARVRGAGLLVE
jgi:hypothetical protein